MNQIRDRINALPEVTMFTKHYCESTKGDGALALFANDAHRHPQFVNEALDEFLHNPSADSFENLVKLESRRSAMERLAPRLNEWMHAARNNALRRGGSEIITKAAHAIEALLDVIAKEPPAYPEWSNEIQRRRNNCENARGAADTHIGSACSYLNSAISV